MILSPRQCVVGALAIGAAPFVLVLVVHALWSLGVGLGWDGAAAAAFAGLFGFVSWVGLVMACAWVACDRWERP